jgi:thymidine kinase
MFSGKTEELLRRVKRARIGQQKVVVCKPTVDDRYDATDVVSHSKQRVESVVASCVEEILKLADDHQVIGIDEVQFFEEGIIEVCEQLANKGVRVIVAGLDLDFLGRPFGPMPSLMAIAEEVTKLHAVCLSCGGLASRSKRLDQNQETVAIGEAESYEARCRTCIHK